MVELRIEGTEKLARISGAIQRNQPSLRKGLLAGLRAGAKPAVREVKDATDSYFPVSGGLAAFVKRSSIGVRTRTSGEGAGVRIVGQNKGHDLAALDTGRVRHPVFGNKKAWVIQQVRPSWWTTTLLDQGDRVRAELVVAMDDFLQAIEKDI